MKILVGEPDHDGHCFRHDIVVMAVHVLKSLGHDKFDRMILEWGLLEIKARPGTSLNRKANSLAEYALKNPEQRTPTGDRLDVAIVFRAANLVEERATIGEPVMGELANLQFHLKHAGYWIDDEDEAVPSENYTAKGGREPHNTERPFVEELLPDTALQVSPAQPNEKPGELFTLKPNFHGIGIDLKEAVRRVRKWWGKQ